MDSFPTFDMALDGVSITMPVAVQPLVVPGLGIVGITSATPLVHFPPQQTSRQRETRMPATRPHGYTETEPYIPPHKHATATASITTSTLCSGCYRCKNGIAAASVMIVNGTDLILMRDAYKREYSEPGGRVESTDLNSAYTASRELYEESCTTIDVSPRKIASCEHIDLPAGRHLHRCYIINLLHIHCSDFYKVNRTGLAKQFLETDEMSRFPLSSIKATYRSTGKIELVDAFGKVQPATSRLYAALEEMINKRML